MASGLYDCLPVAQTLFTLDATKESDHKYNQAERMPARGDDIVKGIPRVQKCQLVTDAAVYNLGVIE